MKKMIFLMLLSFLGITASMNAQVTIGSDNEPDPSAILDLQTNNQGLLLPRVALVSTTNYTPLKAHVAGMTVYNVAVNGSGATTVTPGIYTNDGSKWIRLAEGASVAAAGAPVIVKQPTAFTFSRLKDVNGDPSSDVTSFSKTLTVEATGDATLNYQWYQKPRNTNGAGTAISGATSASYDVNIPADGLSNWGLYSYYCEVSNAKGSIKSEPAAIALGCGAKTVNGGWLSFMCYNLGADTSLPNPFTYVNLGDDVDNDSKGWLFQWGRRADGHQLRTSQLGSGTYTGNFDENGQIPDTDDSGKYGNFISGTAPTYDWRSPKDDNLWSSTDKNNPCPTGWGVPTLDDWQSIFHVSQTSHGGWSGPNIWKWSNGTVVQPVDNVTTLFLPLAGMRNSTRPSGISQTKYHTATSTGISNVFITTMQSGWFNIKNNAARADAYPLRCVAK